MESSRYSRLLLTQCCIEFPSRLQMATNISPSVSREIIYPVDREIDLQITINAGTSEPNAEMLGGYDLCGDGCTLGELLVRALGKRSEGEMRECGKWRES